MCCFSLYEKLNYIREVFWFAISAGLNFLPLKIGALINYGWFSFYYDIWFGWITESIPAEGWVNTYGTSGKKEWSGKISGNAFGFTGIKIIKDLLHFYYLGSALHVRIKNI